mgnify:FL=1
MTSPRRPISLCSLAVLLAIPLAGCLEPYASTTEGGDATGGTSTTATTGAVPTTGSTGGSTGEPLPPAEVPAGCNPIAYEGDCMLPYPSDWFLVPDASLPGGVRVELTDAAAPKTSMGVPVNTLVAHPADGFSHHMPILALFPAGVDTANLTFHTDGGDATLDAKSPTLLIDAATQELVPHWVELDAMTDDVSRQALIVRPFVPLKDGARYIVAFQGLVGKDGAAIPQPLGFAHIARGEAEGHPVLGPLATRYEADIFPALEKIGVARGSLQLAWDFTTATDERNTRDMLAIRDDIMAAFEMSGPPVTIDKVLMDPSDEIALRVEGKLEVPLYLEEDAPMAKLHRGPDGGVTPNGTTTAAFTLQVPKSAYPMGDPFVPARIVQFGHGFFGEREEINWSAMKGFSAERGLVMVAVEWAGMAAEDQPKVVDAILKDPSSVFQFTDRLHQGFANQLALSVAIQTTLAAADELKVFSKLVYDPEQLYWYGISQGSIFGMTFLALTPTIEKGVLSVGGGPYSLMMTRSGSFADLFSIVRATIGDDPLLVQKFIAMSQHTWDRVDPITYASRVIDDPLPGSALPKVLFQYGIGDHSVNNLASHLLLRAAGIDMLTPAAQTPYLLGSVPAPAAGSAAVVVDYMVPVLPGVEANLPDEPPDEYNVHELVRRNAKIREQIDAFMRPDGVIENFCDGPCDPE